MFQILFKTWILILFSTINYILISIKLFALISTFENSHIFTLDFGRWELEMIEWYKKGREIKEFEVIPLDTETGWSGYYNIKSNISMLPKTVN